MGYSVYFNPLKLDSLLSYLHDYMKKGPRKIKDLPDQVKDIHFHEGIFVREIHENIVP